MVFGRVVWAAPASSPPGEPVKRHEGPAGRPRAVARAASSQPPAHAPPTPRPFSACLQAACSVHDDGVVPFFGRLRHAGGGDGRWRHAAPLREDGHPDPLAERLQLLDGGRSVHVTCHQQHPLAVRLLQALGQLGGGRRLADALQSRHQDDLGAGVRHRQAGPLPAHQGLELVVHDLPAGFAGEGGSEGGVREGRGSGLAAEARRRTRRRRGAAWAVIPRPRAPRPSLPPPTAAPAPSHPPFAP